MLRPSRAHRWIIQLASIVLIHGSSGVLALDPEKLITQYGRDTWLRQTGLPANAVNVVLQTHDGYLWLGTPAGLFRFDGVRFSQVATDSSGHDSPEAVSTLCETDDGSLWVGTQFNSLCRIKDGKVFRYGEAEGIMSQNITAVLETREGSFWLGTSSGLYLLQDGRFVPVPITSAFVTCLEEDAKGTVWVGTQAGVRTYAGGREAGLDGELRKRTNLLVTSILADPSGEVWIGTFVGLFRWYDGKVSIFTRGNGLPDDHITALTRDEDGNLWVGTNQGGVARLFRGSWTKCTEEEGLCNNRVLSMVEDREGSLWLGTLDGLTKFRDVVLTTYGSKEGLASDYIASIAGAPDGSMYVLSDGGSCIMRLKDAKWSTYPAPVGPAYVARDGTLWVGQSGFVLSLKDGQLRKYGAAAGIPARWISAIGEDSQSVLLAVGGLGIRRFSHGRLQPFLLADGSSYESADYISSFYLEPDGALWIGKSCGLERIKDGQRTDYTANGEMPAHYWIGSFYDDRHGSLWLSSPRAGLTRFREGKFTSYTTREGLFSNEIYCVLGDESGDIWLSSPRGIGHLRREELEDFETGKIGTIHTQVFTSTDGMKTDECFGLWQPAGWKAPDGHLWFATKKGAVVIDPKALVRNELPPPVRIDAVLAGRKLLPPTGGQLTLPAGQDQFEFDYTALSLAIPHRVLFKYRLEGYDRQWVEAGTRRTAFYTNLWPGEYRFRVIACNNDGVWNETGAAIDFYLTPHFYQTYWFYASCCVLLAMAVFALIRLRVRTLKAHERHLESLVTLRTGELQQQRSFLRKIIDLNPTFIFAKDRQGHFTLANRALASAYGTDADALLGKTDADFNARSDEVEKFLADDTQVMDSKTERFIPEEEFTDKEGRQHWMQVIKIPIVSDDGMANQVLGVATDITERKNSEQRLKASLHEKEVLLKEIHHRVKNNLQIVSSLLNLQANQVKYDESRTALSECRQRVRSMALIHENLYRTENLASINFGEYLRTVTNELVRSFGKAGVSASFELESLYLPIDIAIPCGLIVNELVTNALRHAFPENAGGTVTVSLRRHDESTVELSVGDDGAGIDPGLDIRALKSMGVNLVMSLTEQIGGTISIMRGHGTLFRILFPMKQA